MEEASTGTLLTTCLPDECKANGVYAQNQENRDKNGIENMCHLVPSIAHVVPMACQQIFRNSRL